MNLRAMLLLTVLIAGCGIKAPVANIDCPEPPKPDLPMLLQDEPLESLNNIRILMERDDCMRRYIVGLEDALECSKGGNNNGY